VSSQIEPHDIVEGTRWRDSGTLTSRRGDSMMAAKILIVSRERQMCAIWAELSLLGSVSHSKNQPVYVSWYSGSTYNDLSDTGIRESM